MKSISHFCQLRIFFFVPFVGGNEGGKRFIYLAHVFQNREKKLYQWLQAIFNPKEINLWKTTKNSFIYCCDSNSDVTFCVNKLWRFLFADIKSSLLGPSLRCVLCTVQNYDYCCANKQTMRVEIMNTRERDKRTSFRDFFF
jgi:hypothetical protein